MIEGLRQFRSKCYNNNLNMEGFCRGCLIKYSEPTDLLQYTEKSRRLFVYSTGLQVKRNDTFTFQLCEECYFNMKQSCKFKKQCRTSDKKFKNYLMLREDGDNFGSFIRNMDEQSSLRIPLASGHSTPVHLKNRDDDNESTCTSIRNFMTDILDGEELPPSEARIIREVIQEEADVLEDSLDSYWLLDDLSAGSDVDMDFGISPFATPRSVLNDHCYTPRRTDEEKQRQISFLTCKEIIEKTSESHEFDMPLLEDLNSNMDFESVVIPEEVKIENKDTENDNKASYSDDMLEFNNSIPSEVEDMVTENSISSGLQYLKTELLVDFADKKQMDILENSSHFVFDDTSKNITTTGNENDVCIVLSQGTAEKKAPLTNELEYYVNKAELKKRINSTKDRYKDYHCTIDRNLDIALKYEESKEFSLDQLIISPAVSLRSGVSTPTIKNILFGDKDSPTVQNSVTSTPNIENILFGEKLYTEAAPKYFPQVGQSIENFDGDDERNDVRILKDFIMDNDSQAKDNQIEEVIKVESEIVNFDNKSDTIKEEIEHDGVTKSNHIEVLEEFLKGADDPSELNKEIIDQIIDPLEISDQDLFKRPLTPHYDQYDLEKCFCKVCNRKFPSLKSLKIHITKIHKYRFPDLDPHRNKSQNNKVKMCDVCGREVKGAANYVRHIKRHIDKGIDFFQCDNCKLFFNSRPALQVHMRMHMGIINKRKKEFVCPTCGKLSANSTHYKLHMRRHLKEFSVTCDVCHKGFYREYDLRLHMRFHTGERPFTCEYCPKAFKRRDQLYQHMKRHMGIVEKCDICNMEFANKHLLARHYASENCIKKRMEASPKSKHMATVTFGKGSLEKIKKMMQSSASENDIESDNEEIEESMVQSVETGKGIGSKIKPSETNHVPVKSVTIPNDEEM